MHLKEGAKIELQREICKSELQVVCYRLSAGVLQVVYRLFAEYLQVGLLIWTFPVIQCCFYPISTFQKNVLPTDRWMDRQTNSTMDRPS